MKNKIIIKDAKGNNLKNLSIEIPKNKIVLITPFGEKRAN